MWKHRRESNPCVTVLQTVLQNTEPCYIFGSQCQNRTDCERLVRTVSHHGIYRLWCDSRQDFNLQRSVPIQCALISSPFATSLPGLLYSATAVFCLVAQNGVEPFSQPYKDYALPLSYWALLAEGEGFEPTATRHFTPELYQTGATPR